MKSETYIPVGKLGKPHGISGAFRFLLHRELKSKHKFPPHFMLLLNGSYQPWFIKEVDWRGFDEGLILFEEVTTPEKARNYSRHELFLTEKEVNTYFKKDSNSVDFMVGFLAIDEHEGEIGPITAVTENPGQLLLSIDRQGTEVMIPLVDDFIVKLDKRKKQVIFNLPAGLLNL